MTAEEIVERIDAGSAMLVYRGDSGLIATKATGRRAKMILEDTPERVIGVYDFACPYQWIKEDLERYA